MILQGNLSKEERHERNECLYSGIAMPNVNMKTRAGKYTRLLFRKREAGKMMK